MTDKIINTVITGDAREKLKELPAGSVNCIITSPPYWSLRDYGIEPMVWDGNINCEHKWVENIPQQYAIWTIPTEAFPEAHFATFPCALVEPMIKCGCPEFVCPKCGKARVKILKDVGEKTWTDTRTNQSADSVNVGTRGLAFGRKPEIEFRGYTSCSCGVNYEPGIVMDFFSGSGTVGKVAAYLRRNYILIDAKKEYCQMAEERIAEPESGVPVAEQRQGQGSLFEREGQ